MSETQNITETPEVRAFLKLIGQAPAPSDAQKLMVAALTVYVGKIINAGVATKLANDESTDDIPEIIEGHLTSLFENWSSAMEAATPGMLSDLVERYKAQMTEHETEVVENV